MLKVLSQKGKENIVKDGFVYRSVGNVRSGEERWRCCNSKCVAKLYTMEGGMLFSRLEGEHNHVPREQNEVLRKSISNSIKRKAEEEIDQRPSKLIHGEISKCSAALEALTRKDIKYIRNNLTNARLKRFPKLPKSREEVQEALSKLDITTAKDEVFLLANNLENEIAIFSCDSNLRYLCERDTVLMDGTFEFSPKHFTQLFTIHGYSNGTYIPLVYCLLPDKRKQTYTEALGMVKEECVVRNLQLMPKNIVVDFEQAIHSSIDDVFPASAKVGCRFHLGQSWWRKIQQLGLACTYKDSESEAGKWLHYCFGLTYLSPEDVEEVFCDLIAIQPAGEKLSNFADYLTETYIDRSCCLFPPKIWAADSAELWRTTNSCESFHSRYNELCPSPHPNIFVFLKNLNICQVECYIRINSVSKGEVVKSRKTTCLRQEFLEKKITQVKNGEIDLLTFVKCVAYKSAPNVQ